MKTILFVYGTRPEAIKMAPLINEFLKYQDKFKIRVCCTGQHRQMLDQVNKFFKIEVDYDLNIMQQGQSLSDITTKCISALSLVIKEEKPNLIFIQGDTTTVMATAIVAFYNKVPVAHLEAGLRSGNRYLPFPEEINRKITGQIADWHFAPTKLAENNLHEEGIKENIYVVGNTVIDALLLGLEIISKQGNQEYKKYFESIDFSKKILLVTGHRRESFGDGFENICQAIKIIAEEFCNIEIVYPVHLNPNVQEPVKRILKNIPNVHLFDPLDYPYLIWLMKNSYLVLTDSGGIQEEAPALGKPVLVMREVTERVEGIDTGTAILVGTKSEKIVSNTRMLLLNNELYNKMAKSNNPYGNGQTSKNIVKIFLDMEKV